MTLNKRKSFLYLSVLTVIAFIFFSIFNNSHTIETHDTVIDRPWEKYISIYNWDYLKHHLYTLLGVYKGYPWTVWVSYGVIVVSSVAMIALLYVMLWDVYVRKKNDRAYRELKAKYYDKLKALVASEKELTEDEIRDRLDMTPESQFGYVQNLQFIDLLLKLRMETAFTPHTLLNLQRVVRAMGLYEFMEKRLIAGRDRDKMKIIQAIRLLHMEIADSLMARLINHREAGLRKAARLYYILSNEEDPFRYFENNASDKDFLPWDKLETHQLFEDCTRLNKRLPSFIPILGQGQNALFTEFLIKETAYWGSKKESDFLLTYLDSDNESLRKAAIEGVSMRNPDKAAELLTERYYRQPEQLRRAILHALLVIAPIASISFFREAYENTASLLTKRIALYCLWNAGDAGRDTFRRLKETARPNEKILFEHVENEIINQETAGILSSSL